MPPPFSGAEVGSEVNEQSSLLYPGRNVRESERNAKIVKAFLYAVQVFYSFFIM
jgi:hypothetical protein